jgi:hypothetical protein
MDSYFRDHVHTQPPAQAFRSGLAPESYASVTGVVDKTSEHPITGHSGDHLQFYVGIGGGARYQIDVNTQSENGSAIEVYVADEALQPAAGGAADQPFGPPAYGVSNDAQLSYAGLGLQDTQFQPVGAARIEARLEQALNQSAFVAAYGMVFNDGGPSGMGAHEIHYTGKPNQDGALAVYIQDPSTGAPKRTWFFFKFDNDRIGQPAPAPGR